ncbi:sodium/calcium exchanger 1-like [Diadema setosum]|uniref:sodium/calcium exchanger 1-like n=1 Tax=Diadema setosum TaxID=31175 RepID=UPI003B3B58B0
MARPSSGCVWHLLQRTFFRLTVCFLLLQTQSAFEVAAQNQTQTPALPTKTEEPEKPTEDPTECKKGLLLPVWMPQENITIGDKIARAIVYFAALAFIFLGVSIIADRFMSAIEVITSKEKEVTIKKPNGEVVTVSVRIWNETVSNLTLMALGSSAPEILLSVIEICGRNFEAGELGPGTIVGSAAFNLFIIIAICIYCIPDGEVRRLKHLRVFFVTATFSLLAYLWMLAMLKLFSPGIIELWEAIVTLMLFPITVVWAYIADVRIFFYRFLRKKYKVEKVVRRGSNMPNDMEMGENEMHENHLNHGMDGIEYKGKRYKDLDGDAGEIKDLDESRKETIRLLRELRQKHPDADLATLEQMANYETLNNQQKSRAFYRIQATRKMCGAGNILKKTLEKKRASVAEVKIEVPQDDSITRVCFDPHNYTVMENVGNFTITVARLGGDMNSTVYVDYKTEDGTANAGSDYHYGEGTLIFKPGETQKEIPLTIIDDDIFEEDEHFYVRLNNIRVGGPDGMFQSNRADQQAEIVEPLLATITILDDDHAGIFHFEDKVSKIPESSGEAQFKVVRSAGARGMVRLPYKTVEGTAKGNGIDFVDIEGELEFENDETWKYISVNVIDDEEYEKNENFFIELGIPRLVRRGNGSDDESITSEKDEKIKLLMSEEEQRIADMGKPQLGEIRTLEVIVHESTEFRTTQSKHSGQVDQEDQCLISVGTSSWREQFAEALTVSAGDDDADGEEKLPSCADYVMHFLTIFWKILFAFVPPTDIGGGWACFVVSILIIGGLTAIIGDLASHFGCTIGLLDSVTAISFVALGTSVPDTFASKTAAVGDKYADASVGNVTGSNAVNVFLGIGVAWTIAAIYHAANNQTFRVEPGSLGFSVTIFSVFAVIAITILLLRRRMPGIGGELGGPRTPKIVSSAIFVTLWLLYLILSSLEAYGFIKGF